MFNLTQAQYAAAEALRLSFKDMVAQTRLVEAKTLNAFQKQTIAQDLIKWDVDTGGDTAVIIPATADRPTNTASSTILPAQLPIGGYKISHTFQLMETTIAQAISTGNPADLTNAIQYKLQNAYTRILRNLNSLIFTGDGTVASGQFAGLGVVADQPDSTGTTSYAGLTHSNGLGPVAAALDEWVSPYVGVTGSQLTESDMLDMEQQFEERESTYNLVIVSPATARKYRELFTSLREFRNTNDVTLGVAADMIYSGRPVLVDNQCPVDTLYFVDTLMCSVYSYRLRNTVDVQGVQFFVEPIATQNGLLAEWEIGILPQLWFNQRKNVGVLELNA